MIGKVPKEFSDLRFSTFTATMPTHEPSSVMHGSFTGIYPDRCATQLPHKYYNPENKKGYYDGCKRLGYEPDLEVFYHITQVKEEAYLTIQRGKDREWISVDTNTSTTVT